MPKPTYCSLHSKHMGGMWKIHLVLASQLYTIIPDSANHRYARVPNSEVIRKWKWVKQRESHWKSQICFLSCERVKIFCTMIITVIIITVVAVPGWQDMALDMGLHLRTPRGSGGPCNVGVKSCLSRCSPAGFIHWGTSAVCSNEARHLEVRSELKFELFILILCE